LTASAQPQKGNPSVLSREKRGVRENGSQRAPDNAGVSAVYTFPERAMPFPDMGLSKCQGHKQPYCSFHIYYRDSKTPGDRDTMFLKNVSWVPFC